MKIVYWRLLAVTVILLFLFQPVMAKPLEDVLEGTPEPLALPLVDSQQLFDNSQPPVGPVADMEGDGYYRTLASWDFETGDQWIPMFRRGSVIPPGTYWQNTSWGGYNGTNSWWCGVNTPTLNYNGYANNWEQYLETPTLDFSGSATTLTFNFMMKAYLEGEAYHPNYDSWDACNVWYSTDNGVTWDVLTGPSLAYNSSSNYAYGNEFGYYYDSGSGMVGTPIPGWMGNVTGGSYVPVTFDISNLIGETSVKFRFGLASDGSESAQNYSAYIGMFVDDIFIFDNNGTPYLQNNADGPPLPSDLIPIEQYDSVWELTEETSNSASHSWHIPNDHHVDHILKSPSVYLPNVAQPLLLNYNVYCDMPDVNSNGGEIDDYYQIILSINNGVSWYVVATDWSTRPNMYGQSLDGWVYRDNGSDNASETLDLTPYKGHNVKLGFRVLTDRDDDDGQGTGIYFDDIEIVQYEGFYDYTWELTDYDWIEIADDPDAQQLTFSSNSQFAPVDISAIHCFEFPYFGRIHPYIKVGASGVLFFDGNNVDFPASMGDGSNIASVIAPLRTPLEYHSRDDAGVYVKNVDGVLVVEWFAAHIEDEPTWPTVFQAHLFADGSIEFHYQVVPYSLPEMSNLTIGLNNTNQNDPVGLWPEMDYLPYQGENAVRFIPGIPSYGHLDVTVIDEETNEVVPDLELYIPRFSQYANTDGNGQVFFDYVPLHESTIVNIELLGDYYVHQEHSVEVQPNTTTEDTMYVRAIMREVRNFSADNYSESEVTLWWDYPDVYYDMASLELYQSDSWSWYTFDDPCVAQGCDFSGYNLEGIFDIEEVSFYLMNRQRNWYDSSHQPDIKVDIWDMTDPDNPVNIFQTSYNPSSSYGWCTVPIGLYGLENPNIAVTLTTPENSGNFAYNLYYDTTNEYGSDLIITDLYEPGQENHLGTMPGDPVMSVLVSYNGHITEPESLGPDATNNGDLSEILEGHEGYYRLGQSAIQPVELVQRAPEGRNPDTGSMLDEYDGVVDHYDIYQNDVLIGSTPDGYTYEYIASGLEETSAYDFYVVPVYQYDAQLIDGPPSPVINISPMMPPDMPTGIDVVISNESTAGGDIALSWTPPALNVDGSPIDDLGGFNLYLNGDFSTPVYSLPVEATSHDIIAATRDFYNFYITALDDAGNESQPFCFGYNMVGTPDDVIDFETDNGGFNTDRFEWGLPTAGPETSFNVGPNLWATNLDGYYENNEYYGLYSLSLHVDAADAWLTFGTWYDFEYGYDGGVVVVSTDNGENWEIADMAEDGSLYNDPFWGAQFNNPVTYVVPDGHGIITGYSGDAWNGTPEGWRFLGVDLDDYIGMDIVVGFIAGTDVANALHYGWYIDDIGLHNISLSPMGSLSGIVTDSDDVPLEHAVISIPGRTVQTDATGAYSITELLVGDYTVNCWKQGYNEQDLQVTIVQDTDTQQDFSLTYPVMNTNGVTDITLDVFPGYTGTYTMSITNDGSGPLMIRPDTHGDILGNDNTNSPMEVSSIKQPGDEPVTDDYSLPMESFPIPYPLMSMNGITLDEASGNLYITDKQTSGIYIVNPETGSVVDAIPTPYAPADGEGAPFPGGVEFNGPDLWFSWHEVVPPPVQDTESAPMFRTHVVRITDYETGAFDVEFVTTDMGWNGTIEFFDFLPDYNGMIISGFNYDLGENAFAFTSPVFTQTADFVTPTVTIVRILPYSRPEGLELGLDGNLWVIGGSDSGFIPAMLYQVTMPDMTVMAEITVSSPDANTVAGLEIDSEGRFITVDATRAYLFEAGFGHPYFSTPESRYYFSPGMTGDIVFDVNIPEMAMVGDVFELLLALHNNGMPYDVEIPVVLNVNEPVWTHDISLQGGWNLSSINLMPLNPAVDMQLPNMFGAEIAAGNLVLIKDNDGNIFDPVSGLNQIGDWDPLQGYKIKVVNPTTVPVNGYIFDIETGIDLFTGWNMVSYLPQDPINTWEAVSSIMNQVIIVKDGHGNFFMPAYGYNGIGNMMPMDGYQVKVTGNTTLYYPYSGPRLSDPVEQAKASQHFTTSLSQSGPSFSLLINGSDIDGGQLSANDEVAIYDDRGRIISSAVWGESGMVGLPVWIDDANTETIEGVAEGGIYSVQVWLADEDIMIPANLEYIDGDRQIKGNGYQVASISGSVSSVIPGKFFLSQNYPNPFNPSTTIKYGLPEDALVQLEIFNVLGQKVRTLAHEQKQAGYYTIVWDGLDSSGKIVSSGTYFYRLRAGEFTQMHRMVVTK